MPAVLDIQNLAFGYDAARPILRGFNARLESGRVCALIGPNAAGKSTLMKLMLGQLSASAGGVQLDGRPVDAMSPADRAKLLSYVPQRASVSFAFNVEEIVAMGRFSLPHAPGSIDHAIRSCDLEGIRTRPVNQLSFGQQQRVLLARAMAQSRDGKAMLLDEPGSAMDLWHVHRMMQSLTHLAKSGLAVLIVLHDLNLVARYADDVWVLNDGQLVASGPWAKVLRPEVLEPVYKVKLQTLSVPGEERPVFHIVP